MHQIEKRPAVLVVTGHVSRDPGRDQLCRLGRPLGWWNGECIFLIVFCDVLIAPAYQEDVSIANRKAGHFGE